jgi:amino acid transporter
VEKIRKIVSLPNENNLIKEMELFEWKVVFVQYKNDKVIVDFERDTALPYYSNLTKMERKIAALREPPLWPLFVLVILAFMLVTAILVLWIVLENLEIEFQMLKWLGILGFPAVLISFCAIGFIFLRAKKIEKLDEEKTKLRNEIKSELEEIKRKYGN